MHAKPLHVKEEKKQNDDIAFLRFSIPWKSVNDQSFLTINVEPSALFLYSNFMIFSEFSFYFTAEETNF